MTIRPLPLPEFHLLLRRADAGGAHKPADRSSAKVEGFYLERTEHAVLAFGPGIPPTRFQFYFIGLVARSRATCTTGLASFSVGPRVAFFVPPAQIHSSRGWTTTDRGFALSFSEAFFSETLSDKSILRRCPLFAWERPPFLALDRQQDDALRATFALLEREWKSGAAAPGVLRPLLHAIVAQLERAALRAHPATLGLDASARLHQAFRARLETHFRTEKSPAAYATALGVHANHFATAVRTASGLPPGEWIRARVVLEAQCLLASTTLSVKEVATELGYEDEAYFSRLFKHAVGVAPRDYQIRSLVGVGRSLEKSKRL
jgi:AraC-like DNA-binding protein